MWRQLILETALVTGVLRRLERLGVPYIAAPYPYKTEPHWRILAAGLTGVEGEDDINPHTAAGVAEQIAGYPGVRASRDWPRVAAQLH